ncbi:MAG: type IV secretion system DNA-binding domain-containing protein [Candidatus Saccharibacteria bacterium]|nr:type IV secretion system DNA-binding domain-containing protein [Candidatus Saccharibacteria bacterium]
MQAVIRFVLMPIFWIPVVGILIFLTYRNYKKLNTMKVLNVDSVLLMLEIPRANDKKELAAEQLFASLHGILRDSTELKNSGGIQEYLSFEIVSTAGQIRFFVWTPKILRSFVEGQIYAQYPTVQIYRMNEDYVDERDKYPVAYSAELNLVEPQPLPIKTFDNFEVDPLAGITGTLAKLNTDSSEEMWIQILTRPIPDDWHKNTTDKWVKKIKSGQKGGLFSGGIIDWTWVREILWALIKPPEGGGASSETKVELSERAKTQIAKAEEKATKLGYEVKIRLVYLGSSEIDAKLNMQALVGTFKQFNSTNLNGFKQVGGSFNRSDLDAYKMRQFSDHGFILNISELASVYHLPHTSVETPNIVWATSKTAEPPSKLPVLTGDDDTDKNISAFGLTNFRGVNHQFGFLRRDRSRHIYVIGQTGTGKSGLLELLALSDIFHDQGYCIIDPHGDFAIDNLKFIPESRIDDVIYFNPADTAYPVAFNPLEVTDPSRKPNICSEVVGVLKRMFGDSWGPRLEHILRYTLLALLDRPQATLLDISRLLTDKEFRKETLNYCKDVTVLQFWKQEFGQWNDKQINESIAPVLNKVGAFTANPIIRNIIGQAKSSFDVRKIMDEGKILVVNLSKGLVGEDNAGILGSFLVTKVQLAAMSRSDIARVEDRRPFYLYVDEFQNFATDSFSVILSEARKYGLNLTVANQYVSQMTDSVRDAVFGNVGTTISFRVSADDAPILAKQFEPVFEASDLLQLNNRHFIISMIIGGEKVPAFSATTLSIPSSPEDNFDKIVAYSREKYARKRLDVEEEIRANIEQSEKYKKELSDSGRQAGEEGIKKSISLSSASASTSTKYSSNKTEHKPNYNRSKSPVLSPNQVSGKTTLGLKDLTLDTLKQAEKNNSMSNKEKGNKSKDSTRATDSNTAGRENGENPESRENSNKPPVAHDSERAPKATSGLERLLSASKADNSKPSSSDSKKQNDPKSDRLKTIKQLESNPKDKERGRDSNYQRADRGQKIPDKSNEGIGSTKTDSKDEASRGKIVMPEVEYQEKDTIVIVPDKKPLSLSKPVNNPDRYANKDNSVDGFLAIKH